MIRVKSGRAQGRMWSDVCCGAVIGIDIQEAFMDARIAGVQF
jgi:hypothetical protein